MLVLVLQSNSNFAKVKKFMLMFLYMFSKIKLLLNYPSTAPLKFWLKQFNSFSLTDCSLSFQAKSPPPVSEYNGFCKHLHPLPAVLSGRRTQKSSAYLYCQII